MEIDVSGENVLQLPVKGKEPVGESFLTAVPYTACKHYQGPFEVDVDRGMCKCLACGGDVTPIFVLKQLMQQESQWMRTRAAYIDEMKRLGERSRTKCQHCGEMTRISRA